MGDTGKTGELPKQTQNDLRDRKKPPQPTAQDADDEDGDIATPKRDAYGNDDEPL
jgi:hypothetical protein